MYKFTIFIVALCILNHILLCRGDDEDICSLPLVTGPCRASFKKYGYDTEKCECVEFTYGGCKGNANRFDTKEECEDACVN